MQIVLLACQQHGNFFWASRLVMLHSEGVTRMHNALFKVCIRNLHN